MNHFKISVTALACAAVLAACGGSDDGPAAPTLSVLSSKPEFVSGGDALVEVALPPGASASQVALTVNGKTVATTLKADAASGKLRGMVTGLTVGANTVVAKLSTDSGSSQASLALTNYPSTGPILAGELLTPYECRTTESNLGNPLDANCSVARRFDYFYRTSAGTFKPLTDPLSRPTDLVTTTTNAGATVPYIVRVDSGTVGRTIYRIAILDNPSAASVDPAKWTPSTGWNKKLVVSFGGGAGTQYNQGVNQAADVLSDLQLSRGFAHMISTELVNGQRGNAVLQGETLMMLKELFIESYGTPKWTMGSGGSGGAIQQLTITQMYPGLLDGLQPSLTFPDGSLHVADCRLLENVYKADLVTWTNAKRLAVDGFTTGTCRAWDLSFVNTIVATNAAGCALKDTTKLYNPVTNKTGARCTTSDMRTNIYSRDPATGFARSPLDNVGLQYGLQALNKGLISPDEFVTLNEKVGGYDVDGNPVAQRKSGDVQALTKAYESGLLNAGGGGLATVPILHSRTYNDAVGDIHSHERDLNVRARLLKANGRFDNQVIWVGPRTGFSLAPLSIDLMNDWLDKMAADPAPLTIAKVVANKPAAAVDACFDPAGTKIAETPSIGGTGPCAQMYPVHGEPRMQAGAPAGNDVLKCQLKPIAYTDYTATFTPAQKTRLEAVFPGGVCDWTKPGVGQVAFKGTYQKY
ncbi:MAG: hypothetical protein JWR35_3702 [Marmoricola sp.]|nr:hypothetical protein [Marmoricola sp.]